MLSWTELTQVFISPTFDILNRQAKKHKKILFLLETSKNKNKNQLTFLFILSKSN